MRIERGYDLEKRDRGATIRGLIHSSRRSLVTLTCGGAEVFVFGRVCSINVGSHQQYFFSELHRQSRSSDIFFWCAKYIPCTHTWSGTYACACEPLRSYAEHNQMILFFFFFFHRLVSCTRECVAWLNYNSAPIWLFFAFRFTGVVTRYRSYVQCDAKASISLFMKSRYEIPILSDYHSGQIICV